MKTRDFREIQISSSLLVFIFLGVLALGVVIFLLGINVGKKQSAIVADTRTPAHTVTEVLPKETPVSAAPAGVTASEPQPSAPEEKTREKPEPLPQAQVKEKDPQPAAKAGSEKIEVKPETKSQSKPAVQAAYAIQVGAYDDRVSARQVADRFVKRGYTAVVLEPFPDDRKPFFRVRLRGYASRETAQAALDGLNTAEKKKTGYYLVRE